MRTVLRLPTILLAVALTASAIATTPLAAQAAVAEGEGDCAAYDDPVYAKVKPTTGVGLLTPWTREATNAERYGFTVDGGIQFEAAIGEQPNLNPVHRLYRKGDFDYLVSPEAIRQAVAAGYLDQGSSFSASATAQECLVAVHRFVKNGKHRTAVTTAERTALEADGWTDLGAAFYAAPVDGAPAPAPAPAPDAGDTKFGIAVMPDTQQEVLRAGDTRFLNRTRWLASQADELDLRFVTHSGDVVNWGNYDRSQYEIASKAMEPLESNQIPHSLAIGNHDTGATCQGGGACDPKRTRALFRDTSTFNDYFTADDFGAVAGAYEAGKVDNIYSTFSAGGLDWMVLNVEMWPRPGAVDWAKRVIAAHPDHNVLVVTHMYLNGDGSLGTRSDYGDTSPQELWEQVVSQYANVRMVFSGHVGMAATRTDTGVKGNKVYSFQQTIHDNLTNPTRLLEIDTASGSIKTWIYSPFTDQSYPGWSKTITGVDWVR